MIYYDRIDIIDIYKKYCLNFQSTQGNFFLTFLFVSYEMIVIVNMIWKSVNLSK